MTAFQGAVDATFAAFGTDGVYTPAGGEPVSVRVIARSPDTIVGFGETRIHAETVTFEARASDVAIPASRRSDHGRWRDVRRTGRAGAARSRPAGVDARCQARVSAVPLRSAFGAGP
jgi:hypothetical protein